jgi:hypothetical protein
MKSILLFLPLLWCAHGASVAAAEGDCENCTNHLVADTGVANKNIDSVSTANRAIAAELMFTDDQQLTLCYQFLRNGFKALKETFESYGTTIEDGYKYVKCEDGRRDLVKYRQMNYSGRSDIAAFILYYKRDLKREHELPEIFNTVVPGPKIPHGTLLDFIQYYHDMDDLDSYGRGEYEKMMTMLSKYGAKQESEL